MSIKIRNGYLLRAPLGEIIATLDRHRDGWLDAAMSDVVTKLAMEIQRRRDQHMLCLSHPQQPGLSKAAREWAKEWEGWRNQAIVRWLDAPTPAPTFDMQIFSVMPDFNLALIYASEVDSDRFMQTLNAEPWVYFDDTDRPDDLGEEEWKNRKRTWANAIGPSGVPAKRGLSFDLFPRWIKPEIAAAVTRFDPAQIARAPRLRALDLARDAVCGSQMRKVGPTISMVEANRILREIDERMPLVQEIAEKWAEQLPPVYAREIFFEDLPEDLRDGHPDLSIDHAQEGPQP